MNMAIVRPLLQRAFHDRQASISKAFFGSNGERQWMVAVPVFRSDSLHGFALGVFNVDQSLEEMLSDIKGLHFSVAVEEDGRGIFLMNGSNDQHRHLNQTAELELPGTTWHLRVWSSPEAMAEMQSNLPRYTLISGFLFSLLLAWLTYTFFRLRSEINERRIAEEALRASQARFAGIWKYRLRLLFPPTRPNASLCLTKRLRRCSATPWMKFWASLLTFLFLKSLVKCIVITRRAQLIWRKTVASWRNIGWFLDVAKTALNFPWAPRLLNSNSAGKKHSPFFALT